MWNHSVGVRALAKEFTKVGGKPMALSAELKESLRVWFDMYLDAHPDMMEDSDVREQIFWASAHKLARNSAAPNQTQEDALEYLRQLAAL